MVQQGRAMWQTAVVQSGCVMELFDLLASILHAAAPGWCRAEVAASEKERDSQAAVL